MSHDVKYISYISATRKFENTELPSLDRGWQTYDLLAHCLFLQSFIGTQPHSFVTYYLWVF